MRWPTTNKQLLERAKAYADASFNHTFEYAGWDSGDAKMQQKKAHRILVGRFGQEWFTEVCRLNRVAYRCDETSASQADRFDLKVLGYTVDVKTSDANLPPQVSPGVLGRSQVYLFLKTNAELSHVDALGFISSKRFGSAATLVPHGSVIQTTTLRQVFREGSYFLYDLEKLIGFEEMMAHLAGGGTFSNYRNRRNPFLSTKGFIFVSGSQLGGQA